MSESNIKREIAYKVRVAQLHMGSYVKQEGWLPNYVQLNDGRKVSRVNVIGTVIDANLDNEMTQDTIILDDSSANIEVRDFEGMYLKKCGKGSIVLIIGKVKEYNGMKYILPEIVKVLQDPKWIVLRNLEYDLHEKEADFDNKYLEKYEKEISEPVSAPTVDDGLVEEEDISDLSVQPTQPAPLNDYKPQFKNEFLDEMDKLEEPEPVKESTHIKIIKFIRSKDNGEGVAVETINSEFGSADPLIDDLLREGEVFEIRPGILKVLE